MGIQVSPAKEVTLNDQHQNGVDTSVESNPTHGRVKGIKIIYVFARNQRGGRKDDGNPLIHALKGRKGFSIMAHWRQQVMSRAREILRKVAEEIRYYDLCMPMPSSSPFCRTVAELVSEISGVPLLEPSFLRKRLVGELLAEAHGAPPRHRPGQSKALASQLHAWEQLDPAATYQAKEVDLSIRPLFAPFTVQGVPPDIRGRRILVVDDLFATGSSLLSIRAILQNQLGAEVGGLCFLSGL